MIQNIGLGEANEAKVDGKAPCQNGGIGKVDGEATHQNVGIGKVDGRAPCPNVYVCCVAFCSVHTM